MKRTYPWYAWLLWILMYIVFVPLAQREPAFIILILMLGWMLAVMADDD